MVLSCTVTQIETQVGDKPAQSQHTVNLERENILLA